MFRAASNDPLFPRSSAGSLIAAALLIGNSVLTEIIFNRPGLGKLIIGALNARDYTLLQGLMIIFAICVIVVNTLTDLAYGLVDPRVKYT